MKRVFGLKVGPNTNPKRENEILSIETIESRPDYIKEVSKGLSRLTD